MYVRPKAEKPIIYSIRDFKKEKEITTGWAGFFVEKRPAFSQLGWKKWKTQWKC